MIGQNVFSNDLMYQAKIDLPLELLLNGLGSVVSSGCGVANFSFLAGSLVDTDFWAGNAWWLSASRPAN